MLMLWGEFKVHPQSYKIWLWLRT